MAIGVEGVGGEKGDGELDIWILDFICNPVLSPDDHRARRSGERLGEGEKHNPLSPFVGRGSG